MKRRQFITLLGGAAAWPLAMRAQQPARMRHIGVLMGILETDASSPEHVAALRRGLQERGWMEGQNIRIDYRWTTGDPELLRALAKELVDLQPEVIVAHTPATKEALRAERLISGIRQAWKTASSPHASS